ncbi:MAG: hypothetical protein HOM21_12665 [Halobacteriovoraceae bacterium]|nr:hypothetical protein [Halobacteriovoraceae bacterium]
MSNFLGASVNEWDNSNMKILLPTFMTLFSLALWAQNSSGFGTGKVIVDSDEVQTISYNYEKLNQWQGDSCRVDLKNHRKLFELYRGSFHTITGFQWLAHSHPAIDDPHGFNFAMHRMSAKIYRDDIEAQDFIESKVDPLKDMHDEWLKSNYPGNALGDKYLEFIAKSQEEVIKKLKLMILNHTDNAKDLENMIVALRMGTLRKELAPTKAGAAVKLLRDEGVLMEAVYSSQEYTNRHNESCMWNPDKAISYPSPFCGRVYMQKDLVLLERCPGDIHPFTTKHHKFPQKLFRFKKVKTCPLQKFQCNPGCFRECIKYNKFSKMKIPPKDASYCGKMADPLFPAKLRDRKKKVASTIEGYFDKIQINFQAEEDVFRIIKKAGIDFYKTSGEMQKGNCYLGKWKVANKVLDNTKKLISALNNYVAFYTQAGICHRKLAQKERDRTTNHQFILKDEEKPVKSDFAGVDDPININNEGENNREAETDQINFSAASKSALPAYKKFTANKDQQYKITSKDSTLSKISKSYKSSAWSDLLDTQYFN